MRNLRLLPFLILAAASPLSAQATSEWVTRLLDASKLPVSAAGARAEGASNEEVSSVLDVLKREKVPPEQAREILDEERASRREHGPVDNFGGFVQSKLDAGLRGRELAEAIRAEHVARGKGKGKGSDEARRRAEEQELHGKTGAREAGEAGKKPAQAGGRPGEGSGKSGAAGKPAETGEKPQAKGKKEAHPAKPRRR
jgi:hypothetical protein